MVLGISRIGDVVVGAYVGNYTVYKVDIWNSWDELGLIKGITRRPNENNLVFRNRIVIAKNYNASKQGMINWLSDSFDADKYIVRDKKIYTSINPPLSYMQYNKLTDKDEEYFPPEVIADSMTYRFPIDDLDLSDTPVEFDGYDGLGNPLKYTYSFEKTVIWDITKTKTWTLWKDINQAYFPLWEGSNVPNELILRYQAIDDDGNFFIIEESVKRLTRNAQGNIVEE